MLNQIKQFFEQQLSFTSSKENPQKTLHIASAALFLEMMTMDDKLEQQEQALILDIIQKRFSLSYEAAIELMQLADQQRRQATDYFQFTSLINQAYSLEQKTQLIKSLWNIAFIDGVLDTHEEYLVRKIADLLHVPHTVFIALKNQATPG